MLRFHFIAGGLVALTALLFYWLIFGFERDLKQARVAIQKESVESARNPSKVRSAPDLHPLINKTLVERSKEEPAPESENETIAPSPMAEAPPSADPSDSEKTFWCRNVPLLFETTPIRCVYPDACYGCQGAIIEPEIENAIPLCANGLKAQLYHVECCPGFANGSVDCPKAEECFRADPVVDHCSCNDRSDCKLIQLDERIDCVCAP